MPGRKFLLDDHDGNGVPDGVDDLLDDLETAWRLAMGADRRFDIDRTRLIEGLIDVGFFSRAGTRALSLNALNVILPELAGAMGPVDANRIGFAFLCLSAVARRLRRIDPDDGDPMTMDRAVLYRLVDDFAPGSFILELLRRFEEGNRPVIVRMTLGPRHWSHLFGEIDAEIVETFDDLGIRERATSAGPLPY